MPGTSSHGLLNKLLDEIGTTKTAALRKAADEPLSEPGGYMGATTHPSKSVDDHTQKATTGSRASENERDVKDNREKPSVNATAEASAQSGSGSQDERQLNIGTNQSATGEDPKVETKIPVATEAQKAQSNADAAAHKSDVQPPRK